MGAHTRAHTPLPQAINRELNGLLKTRELESIVGAWRSRSYAGVGRHTLRVGNKTKTLTHTCTQTRSWSARNSRALTNICVAWHYSAQISNTHTHSYDRVAEQVRITLMGRVGIRGSVDLVILSCIPPIDGESRSPNK